MFRTDPFMTLHVLKCYLYSKRWIAKQLSMGSVSNVTFCRKRGGKRWKLSIVRPDPFTESLVIERAPDWHRRDVGKIVCFARPAQNDLVRRRAVRISRPAQ